MTVLITIAVLEILTGAAAVLYYRRTASAADERRRDLAGALERQDRQLAERERALEARELEAAEHIPVLTDVLISTKRPDDQAIRGLLDLDARGPVLHLVDARIIDGENELPAPHVRVERNHVAYMQVL